MTAVYMGGPSVTFPYGAKVITNTGPDASGEVVGYDNDNLIVVRLHEGKTIGFPPGELTRKVEL